MRALKKPPLLLHEVFFGAFLFLTWARLVFAAGFFNRDALIYLLFLVVNAFAIYPSLVANTEYRWRLRLAYYPIAMNLAYAHMRVSVPLIHAGLEDEFLQKMDSWLIGTNLSLRIEPLVHPLWNEVFGFCYLLFLPYLTFSMVWYFVGDLALLKKFYSGLFTIYGIGFVGYTVLPALGPYLAMADQFTVPFQGGWFTHWNAQVVGQYSNRVDIFPSLHCAVSSYLLFFDRMHKPWRFRFYLVPCVGLWFSTIYLRYHYFVDLIVGFGLAALVFWLVQAERE